MVKTIACLLAFCAPFLVARVAQARDGTTWGTSVVCAQSTEEGRVDPLRSRRTFCLLRLAPIFNRTSVDITPLAKTSFSRWGAQLELRF